MPTELVEHAREHDSFDSDEHAEETVDAVLETLAERLSEGEAEDLAEQLPMKYANELQSPAPRHPQEYSVPEFLDRVEQRGDLNYEGREPKTAAVLTALADTVSGDELALAREQLPEEYNRLFNADA
ncbi:DUF2267 domain-containing protein [Halobacterium sp. KA-4]|uniref:DUF2267 domain-containing protein n=1 Tax=Halobacterium sp. KA-4 TaxID=2896367 RepID=UPI001E3EFFA4|nr:DUF2267 domain-containing protein [Halobacterium sp. KA-4]MCD2199424.1 DUF2267 domain-containing protein [Halobacterium sp. KA-4]